MAGFGEDLSGYVEIPSGSHILSCAMNKVLWVHMHDLQLTRLKVMFHLSADCYFLPNQ